MAKIDIDRATDEHFARIHRAALLLTGNPWDADDLAQETFLVLTRQSDRFQGRSSLYTWLYGILLNLDRRQRRRHGVHRRKLQVLYDEAPQSPSSVPAAETAIEVSEWKAGLWALVARLPDGQRQALVLRFSEGLRYDEISVAMDCPLGTVKSRIYHGLRALRRLIDKEHGEDAAEAPEHPYEDVNDVI